MGWGRVLIEKVFQRTGVTALQPCRLSEAQWLWTGGPPSCSCTHPASPQLPGPPSVASVDVTVPMLALRSPLPRGFSPQSQQGQCLWVHFQVAGNNLWSVSMSLMGDHRVQGSPFWRTLGFSERRRWAGQEILGICVCAQSWPTLYDPVDCNPSRSSVPGISQARTLEWSAISSSWGSRHPGIEPVSLVNPALAGGFFIAKLPGKPGMSLVPPWMLLPAFYLPLRGTSEQLTFGGKMILFWWSDSLVSSVLGSEADVGLRETFPTL